MFGVFSPLDHNSYGWQEVRQLRTGHPLEFAYKVVGVCVEEQFLLNFEILVVDSFELFERFLVLFEEVVCVFEKRLFDVLEGELDWLK